MEVNQQRNWTQQWVMCSEYLDDIVLIPIIPDDYAIENNLNEDLPGICYYKGTCTIKTEDDAAVGNISNKIKTMKLTARKLAPYIKPPM